MDTSVFPSSSACVPLFSALPSSMKPAYPAKQRRGRVSFPFLRLSFLLLVTCVSFPSSLLPSSSLMLPVAAQSCPGSPGCPLPPTSPPLSLTGGMGLSGGPPPGTAAATGGGQTGSTTATGGISNSEVGAPPALSPVNSVPLGPLLTSSYVRCPMPRSERVALLSFFHSLGGPSWLVTDSSGAAINMRAAAVAWARIQRVNWLDSLERDDDPCQGNWLGVECWTVEKEEQMPLCTAGIGSVVLSDKNLTGTIPDSTVWHAWPGLRRLDLSSNQIVGDLAVQLPSFFETLAVWPGEEFAVLVKGGSQTRMQMFGPSVNLAYNSFAGGLPIDAINSVTKLYFLSLANNPLISESIEHLFAYEQSQPRVYPHLIELDLCCMHLYGPFPRGLSRTLPNLRSLDVSQNSALARQPLPEDLPTESMERIVLHGCAFEGNIPNTWIEAVGTLTDLSLYNNVRLNGSIPAFLGQAPYLKTLLLHNNQFVGSPWPAICSSVRTTSVYFSLWRNQFSGLVDPCLKTLLLDHLTKPFGSFYPAHSFSLAFNRFNNSLSDDSMAFITVGKASMDNLFLNNNEFTATSGFASYWSQLNSVQNLQLQNNPLNFTLDAADGVAPVPTSTALLNPQMYTPLTGVLAERYVQTPRPVAATATTVFSGLIALRSMGQLTQLDLSSCRIRGSIASIVNIAANAPRSFSFERLLSLNLRNNSLQGSLSSGFLARLNALHSLDLSLNPLLYGHLDAYDDFQSVLATGNPLLTWTGSLSSSLQIDAATPYVKDPNFPGRICPVFRGADQQTRTFSVDSSYYQYTLCECDSGFFEEYTDSNKEGRRCVAIPAITQLQVTESSEGEEEVTATEEQEANGVQAHEPAMGATNALITLGATPSPSNPLHFTPSSFSVSPSSSTPASVPLFSDSRFGSRRMLTGLDTSWLVDARHSPKGVIRTIAITLQFHPLHFTQAYNRLEVFMGDETLEGDRLATFTGQTIQKKANLFCYPNTKEEATNEAVTYTDGALLSSSPSSSFSPFNDSACVYFASVSVFSNQATLNFRSRDQSRNHFVASYSAEASCPDGFDSPDHLNRVIDQSGTVEIETPFVVGEAYCAPVFELQGTLQAVVIAVGAFVALLQLCLIASVYYYRDHSVMKSASPEYLILCLFGLLLLAGGSITFALSPSLSPAVCDCRVWLVGLGVVLSLTAFDIKTERIRQIYSTATLKRRTMSVTTMAILLGVIMTVEVGLLALHSGLDMYSKERVYGSGATLGYVVATCSSSSAFAPWIGVQIAIMFLLLSWATYNAWRIRKAATAFNESSTAAGSVVLYMFFALALVPLQSLLSDQPNAQMLIMGLGLALCSLLESIATVCIKLYYIKTNAKPLAALLNPIPTKFELPGEASHMQPQNQKQQQEQQTNGKPALQLKIGTGDSTPKIGTANVTPKNAATVQTSGTEGQALGGRGGTATPTPKQGLATPLRSAVEIGTGRALAHTVLPGMFKSSNQPTPQAERSSYRGVEDQTPNGSNDRIICSNQFQIPDSMGTVAPSSSAALLVAERGRRTSHSDSDDETSREREDRVRALSAFTAGALSNVDTNPLSQYSQYGNGRNPTTNPLSQLSESNWAEVGLPSVFVPIRSTQPLAPIHMPEWKKEGKGKEKEREEEQGSIASAVPLSSSSAPWLQPSRPMSVLPVSASLPRVSVPQRPVGLLRSDSSRSEGVPSITADSSSSSSRRASGQQLTRLKASDSSVSQQAGTASTNGTQTQLQHSPLHALLKTRIPEGVKQQQTQHQQQSHLSDWSSPVPAAASPSSSSSPILASPSASPRVLSSSTTTASSNIVPKVHPLVHTHVFPPVTHASFFDSSIHGEENEGGNEDQEEKF